MKHVVGFARTGSCPRVFLWSDDDGYGSTGLAQGSTATVPAVRMYGADGVLGAGHRAVLVGVER